MIFVFKEYCLIKIANVKISKNEHKKDNFALIDNTLKNAILTCNPTKIETKFKTISTRKKFLKLLNIIKNEMYLKQKIFLKNVDFSYTKLITFKDLVQSRKIPISLCSRKHSKAKSEKLNFSLKLLKLSTWTLVLRNNTTFLNSDVILFTFLKYWALCFVWSSYALATTYSAQKKLIFILKNYNFRLIGMDQFVHLMFSHFPYFAWTELLITTRCLK
ncbi:hypothetical protein RFI_10167 [Reticulomyxa filosa]|uniref:Uncharacterized protein n=1 Tax=Reticulomyxa filosa TaxID=46433 RepID=X6NMR0_RETFI|nr:hypothetical protein RFI_10167 [Reticulomyxa filosa]|eukprot:ETO26969.1 hypothetical protein RFI_10167 [Reticulomyxa filosa]